MASMMAVCVITEQSLLPYASRSLSLTEHFNEFLRALYYGSETVYMGTRGWNENYLTHCLCLVVRAERAVW